MSNFKVNLDESYVYHYDEYDPNGDTKTNLRDIFDGQARIGNVPNFVVNENGLHGVIGACHAALGAPKRWAGDTKISTVLIALSRYENYKDVSEQYFDMILAPDSPWSSLWAGQESPRIHVDSNGLRVAVEIDVYKDTSSQLLMNFAIATRFPFEGTPYSHWDRVNQIDNMNIVNELGIEGTRRRLCALFSLAGYDLHTKDRVSLRYTSEYTHHPLSISFGMNFFNGTPKVRSQYYQSFDSYYPCNDIWVSGQSIIKTINDKAATKEVEHTGHFKVTLAMLCRDNGNNIFVVTKESFKNVINSL